MAIKRVWVGRLGGMGKVVGVYPYPETQTHTRYLIPLKPQPHTYFGANPIPDQNAGSCALPILKIQVVHATHMKLQFN